MTSQQLPGTDAARHGAGDADLAIMLAAHRAFRRDPALVAQGPPESHCGRSAAAQGWYVCVRCGCGCDG